MGTAKVHYLKGLNVETRQRGYIPCASAVFARNHKPVRRRERKTTTDTTGVTCERCKAIIRHETAMERQSAEG